MVEECADDEEVVPEKMQRFFLFFPLANRSIQVAFLPTSFGCWKEEDIKVLATTEVERAFSNVEGCVAIHSHFLRFDFLSRLFWYEVQELR